jgi:hypothetical protein
MAESADEVIIIISQSPRNSTTRGTKPSIHEPLGSFYIQTVIKRKKELLNNKRNGCGYTLYKK